MIDVNNLRKGVTFEENGDLFKVLDYEHHKPGRGKATIRIKVRNLRSGQVMDKSYISGDRVQDVRLDHHMVQYLYTDGTFYHFMDLETYEQPAVRSEVIEEAVDFLTEGLEVKLTFYGPEALDIELPTAVDLEVTESEIAIRGDRATGVTKRVVTQTGLEVQVPAFVEVGDTIRIDTRSGDYVTRV